MSVNEIKELENRLRHGLSDFSAAFIYVQQLHSLICENSLVYRPQTIDACQSLITNNTHTHQKKAYFYFRRIGQILVYILEYTSDPVIRHKAASILTESISDEREVIHHAISDALGESKPLWFSSNNALWEADSHHDCSKPTTVIFNYNRSVLYGRSRVTKCSCGGFHVLKYLNNNQNEDELVQEAFWQSRLSQQHISPLFESSWPVPVSQNKSFLIPLHNPPENAQARGIMFYAPPGYFSYPNEPEHINYDQLQNTLCMAARDLGRLSSYGVFHTAVIPLFHNRIQQNRRDDAGVYDWRKAGRLDRWLHSSRFPNISVSGIRDLEHFELYNGSPQKMYTTIGEHMLSLSLIAGSFFRLSQKSNKGEIHIGGDYRPGFDPQILSELLQSVAENYLIGFTGLETAPPPSHLIDYNTIAGRMCDEMGVDQHMEEVLRVRDQKNMSQTEFDTFFKSRGIPKTKWQFYEKAKTDITINTGPHLGGYNQKISLPELIRFVRTGSAYALIQKALVAGSAS